MIVENELYRVKIKVGRKPRELLVSAPEGMSRLLVAREIKGLSSHPSVQQELAKLGVDCIVEVIPSKEKSGLIGVAGLSLPDNCR